MVNYSAQNCTDQSIPGLENFVVITQITIVDSSSSTETSVTKPKNTLINKNSGSGSNGGGGGSFGWLALLLIPLSFMRKTFFLKK